MQRHYVMVRGGEGRPGGRRRAGWSPGGGCNLSVPLSLPTLLQPATWGVVGATWRRVGERRSRKRNPNPSPGISVLPLCPFSSCLKLSQRAGCPVLASRTGPHIRVGEKISLRALLGVFGNFATQGSSQWAVNPPSHPLPSPDIAEWRESSAALRDFPTETLSSPGAVDGHAPLSQRLFQRVYIIPP